MEEKKETPKGKIMNRIIDLFFYSFGLLGAYSTVILIQYGDRIDGSDLISMPWKIGMIAVCLLSTVKFSISLVKAK